jgi:antitoxin CptB
VDDRCKRLLYLSQHRGMKETDLLMGNFARLNLETMSEVELLEFEQLLNEGDNDLLNWILQHNEPPERVLGPVLAKIIEFRKSL